MGTTQPGVGVGIGMAIYILILETRSIRALNNKLNMLTYPTILHHDYMQERVILSAKGFPVFLVYMMPLQEKHVEQAAYTLRVCTWSMCRQSHIIQHIPDVKKIPMFSVRSISDPPQCITT